MGLTVDEVKTGLPTRARLRPAIRRRPAGPRFRDEVRDFLRFVRRPRVAPRLPGRRLDNGWWEDWFPSMRMGRLLKWAMLLWLLNLVFLGPLAVLAAGAGGATHRIDINDMPWIQALIWAPLVEELVFRFGLRRPGVAWWLVPITVAIMLSGPKPWAIMVLALVLLLCWWPYLERQPPMWSRRPWPWRYRVFYLRCFPYIFYIASVSFAAVHLYNFNLHRTPLLLLPLLVAPQWVTGLVLGWIRVRRGIGASMLLHAIFNGGPLLVVAFILRGMPEALM
ncbi:CPBP family intramembrane metalloprotease [Pusillimonas sp. TS35]|uniref:CPBP family glutamic-type intramembrane protease n=1 Tax=Paracandidimonas lactea TaxID=2895524 RepID=UPI00136BCE6F|nr:CPBP family glutamic-type intramembrane protease [Paracandidimonas lactea]MYN13458.1 CPBP family intramembrane metalloprotease [Pusillimonas sp. TS35]